MRELSSHCLAVLRTWRLVVLHIVGNALLLTGAALWLLVPEEHVWQLVFAVVSALLVVFLFVWLHAGTLIYAADPAPEKLLAAFRPRVRSLAWLLFGVMILYACLWVVASWSDSLAQASGYLYSKAPSALRPIRGGSTYYQLGAYLLAILFWYVLPAMLLPWTAAKVTGRSFRQGLKALLNWRYWLGMAAAACVGVWLPQLLLQWKPGTGLSQETASIAIRLAVAYALATAAWLTTAGLLGYFVSGENAPQV